MRRTSKALGTLLALAFAGAVGATPLTTLFSGGSLTVGDKLFDNWSLLGQGLSDTTGQVQLSNIDVTGSVSGSKVVLRFNANGELSLSGANEITLSFGYRVSVLPGSTMSIAGVQFDFLQGSFGAGGFHAATEDIFDASSNPLGHIELEASNDLFQASGSAAFNPVGAVLVQKDLLLKGLSDGDSSSLGSFSQTFSQQQVPAPATPLLLAAAGLAWFAARRGRSSLPRQGMGPGTVR